MADVSSSKPATAMTSKPTPADEAKKKPFQRPRPKGPRKNSLNLTESPLTNDPLWKESFILDGEAGLVSEEPAKEFNADATGYDALIDTEYKAIADVDKQYAKSISAAAHAYYHAILYWYELALKSQKRGTASLDQDKLVRFVQGYTTAQITSGAGEYFEGVGDYVDTTGIRHLLKATESNRHGDFGRITARTHGLYETLPHHISCMIIY